VLQYRKRYELLQRRLYKRILW